LSNVGDQGIVSGLSPAAVILSVSSTIGLTLNGGHGGNTFNLNTLGFVHPDAMGGPSLFTLNGGGGNDTFSINAAGLDSDTTYAIKGQDGDDVFTVRSAPSGTTINVDGGTGNNTLGGPAVNATWNIVAGNQGNIASILTSFRNIETLSGGSKDDQFVF